MGRAAKARWEMRNKRGIGKSRSTSSSTSKTKTKTKTSKWQRPDNKTLLQAGALLSGSMDRGSSGGIAGSIIGLDEGSKGDNFFGEQDTKDAGGTKDYYRSEKQDE